MNKITLAKYGFVRDEAQDFSDDGTRFYVYKVGNRVRVSKATWNGQVFLSARIDGSILNYDVYSTLPHYHDLDRLNGVSICGLTENDLVKLYNDCLEYEKEYEEAEKNTVFPTIEELKEQCLRIRAHYKEQADKATKYIEQNATKLIMKASEYNLKNIRYYLDVISRRAEGYDPDKYPQSIQKSCYGISFVKPNYHDLTDTWYYDQIIKTIDEVK